MKKKDVIGERFGRLVIVREEERRGKSRIVTARCDCGAEKIYWLGNLRKLHTQSCGCLFLDIVTKHGHARISNKSPEYKIWGAMVARCSDENSQAWKNYGARGIKVSDEWRSFEIFLRDMGSRPKGTSIDRIDVNGDYCKENCRWATRDEQSNNTTRSIVLEYNGRKMTLQQWANHLGISRGTLNYRRLKGWPVERILNK